MDMLGNILKNDSKSEELLLQLQQIRATLEASGLKVIEDFISADQLYLCYKKDFEAGVSKDQVKIAIADILSYCYARINSSYDCEQASVKVLATLEFGVPELNELAIKRLKAKLESGRSAVTTPQLPEKAIRALLEELARPSSLCSTQINSILEHTLLPYLTENWLRTLLQEMLRKEDVIKMRAYDLAVLLAKQDAEALPHIKFVLDRAKLHIGSGDILMEATVLAIFVDLACADHSFDYLISANIMSILVERGVELYRDPLGATLIPSIMKFFGNVAAINPRKVINDYNNMIELIFTIIKESIENRDDLLPAAMNTLCSIASTQTGICQLALKHASEMQRTLELYAANVHNFSTALKVLLFETLAEIFTIRDVLFPETIAILASWLHILLKSDNLEFLVRYCCGPFEDIKKAALTFLQTLVRYRFGVEYFKRTAGFIEALLKRRQDDSQEIKYVKYEIIKLLAANGEFDANITLKLNTYLNEGPLHVEPVLSVSVEEQ